MAYQNSGFTRSKVCYMKGCDKPKQRQGTGVCREHAYPAEIAEAAQKGAKAIREGRLADAAEILAGWPDHAVIATLRHRLAVATDDLAERILHETGGEPTAEEIAWAKAQR